MKTGIRKQIIEYIDDFYGVKPDYPWAGHPDYCVFRHDSNKKWFALIMNITADKLGLDSDEPVDIINIKCDPLMSGSLRMNNGFFRAWHMNKEGWLSVLLDGTVSSDEIKWLIGISFDLTDKKKKKPAARAPKAWIVPANPKYYDIVGNWMGRDEVQWSQTANIMPGDDVYMYVGQPYSAILYHCRVIETNLPSPWQPNPNRTRYRMRMKKLCMMGAGDFTLERLRDEYKITTIRGRRSVPNSLLAELREVYGD